MWPIIAPNPPFRQVCPVFLIMDKPPLMFIIRNIFQNNQPQIEVRNEARTALG